MNGRKYWIDYAKVFGIFLVVLGHFTPCYRDDYSAQLLYSFHLPLFFIISGYLYKTSDSTTRKQLMGIIQRLIVPYVMLIMLGLGIQFIFIGGGGESV